MNDILIVDDQYGIRKSMLIALQRCGFFVETVGSAAEALIFLTRKQFQFVITDIKMPECNGITLANIVHELYPNTKIILMSSFELADFSNSGEIVRKLPFFKKPVNFHQLKEFLLQNQ